MRWWRRVALAVPLLLALLASQVVRQGSYHGPPFTTVPVWDAPATRGDDGRALQDMLRRAVDHGTPVIVRGGVNHWRAVESALHQALPCPRSRGGCLCLTHQCTPTRRVGHADLQRAAGALRSTRSAAAADDGGRAGRRQRPVCICAHLSLLRLAAAHSDEHIRAIRAVTSRTRVLPLRDGRYRRALSRPPP